ncbi:MAG: DUF4836 family protein [Flavobacteriaceae bacterium]
MKNIKKVSIGMMLFTVVALLFSSCTSTPENLSLVPKETNLVATTNMLSIAQKGQLTDLSKFSLYKGFGADIEKESKIMGEIMKNPFMTGIDYKSDFLLYAVKNEGKGDYMCVSMELSSGDKFTSFLKDLIIESGAPMKIEEKEAYKTISADGTFVLAWDNDKSLLIFPQGYTRGGMNSMIEKLFSLEASDQITANKEFDDFYKNKKDLNLWMSTNFIDEVPMYSQLGAQMPSYFKDNFISMNLGFEKNKIIMSAGLSPNSNMVKEMEKYNIYGDGFNSDLLKYFPKESFITVSGSLNPKGYFKLMSDQPQLSMVEDMFKKEMQMDMKEIVESIKGSMLFSMYDFKATGSSSQPIPLMALVFDINGDDVMKNMMKKVPEEAYNEAGYYEMPIDASTSAYMIFNETTCLVTNDKSRIDLFKKGGNSSGNMSSSKLASNIKNNTMYAYMNADFDSYPQSVKNLMSMGGFGTDVMKTVNKFLLSVEMKMTDDYKGEYIITTGDDGTNSLYKILKAVDDNYMSLMQGF